MASSGTTAFNLDLSDIIEEAYELCGLELRSGYDYRTARRALDLLFLEWQNKGLNLFSVSQSRSPESVLIKASITSITLVGKS